MAKDSREPRMNERIRVPEVRLIGEEGEQIGVVTTDRAREMAREASIDLVEVAANARVADVIAAAGGILGALLYTALLGT